MSDRSPVLSLPLLQPAQAQKHVTHNEALRCLDMLVQTSVRSRSRTEPPPAPEEGEMHIAAAGAAQGWAGRDGQVALYADGYWSFAEPRAGWRVWVEDEARLAVHDGAEWGLPLPVLENLPGLGVNAGHDPVNRLSVSAPATLLSHEGTDHRLNINKAGPDDTASLLFQSGWSGRAEMGLAGGEDWSLKVSADGTSWTEALAVDRASGRLSGAAVQSAFDDPTPGRLLTAGAFGLGSNGESALTDTDSFTVPNGFYTTSASDFSDEPFSGHPRLIVHGTSSGGYQVAVDHATGDMKTRHHDGTGWSRWRPLTPERGSNASGEYARFADGTQICTRDVADGAVSSTSDLNGTFRSDTILYAFPATFLGSPACSMSMRAPGANGLMPSVGDNSGMHWEARFLAPGAFSQATHGGFSLIAVGRWF